MMGDGPPGTPERADDMARHEVDVVVREFTQSTYDERGMGDRIMLRIARKARDEGRWTVNDVVDMHVAVASYRAQRRFHESVRAGQEMYERVNRDADMLSVAGEEPHCHPIMVLREIEMVQHNVAFRAAAAAAGLA